MLAARTPLRLSFLGGGAEANFPDCSNEHGGASSLNIQR
jgi:galactokinase/mevalonate kinase-like predicted kinase